MKRESIIMWLLTGSIMFFGCTENQVPEDEVVKTPTDSVKSDQDTTVVFPKDTTTIVPFDRTDLGDEQSDSLVVNENDTIILGTGHGANTITLECGGVAGSPEIEGNYGPPSIITIVKFHNPEIKKKVIVQHPIKRYYNGYEYYNNNKLYLNLILGPAEGGAYVGVPLYVAEWADEQMHIAGTCPYIPLADGYYMVDWKWDQLMPLSSLAEGHIDAYHDYFKEHILNHVFTTNYEWDDLKNLTIGYDESMHTQHVKGIEIIRVWPLKLACMYDNIGPYWGEIEQRWAAIYYNDGMCLNDAYRYSDGKNGWHPKNLDYIAFCDSMQTVFQSRLIDIINKGQLKEIGF